MTNPIPNRAPQATILLLFLFSSSFLPLFFSSFLPLLLRDGAIHNAQKLESNPHRSNRALNKFVISNKQNIKIKYFKKKKKTN
jgi:hypothetical protein